MAEFYPFQQLLALFVPERCSLCGRPLLYRDHHCCADCLQSLVPVSNGCPLCGGIQENNVCRVCGDRAWYLNGNIPVMEYDASMKELLYQLKVHQKRRLARHLGDLMAARLRNEDFMKKIDFIVPVPVSSKRYRQRGYNQARLLAERTGSAFGLKVVSSLKAVRVGGSQKNYSYTERFLNVPGKFRAVPKKISPGCRILLVDDVFTTGATINECGRVLKEAGAEEIFSVTLARAPIKKLEK